MVFFAILYVAEGAGQTDGLIAQPLNYYLKTVFHWTPVQITAYLTVLNLPWFIKPVYGAMSDFLPLFGYRRRTYLILANLAAVLGYVAIAQASDPGSLIVLLLLTAYGMAISSTVCGALLVENGQRFGMSGAFVNQQWLWFNIAALASALTAGALVQFLPPVSAVHVAALIVGLVPLAVIAGTFTLVDEERSKPSLDGLKAAGAGLAAAFRERRIWLIVAFLFFYYFSPGFDTPLYFHMTDTLKFSQATIGVLGAIGSVGQIAAALAYRSFLQDLSPKLLLNISIGFGAAATLFYLSLFDPATAAIASFLYGAAEMIMLVATLSLAADYCPRYSEGFAFAALMSVTNIAGSAADNVGSFLYERVFDERLAPLVIVSAAATAAAFLLVPLLKLGETPKGETAVVI